MKTGEIIKYALLTAGAYLVWVYVVEPLMAGTTAGTGTPVPVPTGTGMPVNNNTGTTIPNLPPAVVQTGTGNPVITQPPAVTPVPPPQTNMTAATALANALVQASGGVTTLNPDQWSYYYAMLPGRTAIPPGTFNSMLAAGGVSDRTQAIPVGSFVIMLASSGLGDIVPVSGSMIGLGATTGFRRKKTNGFGGNPHRMTVQ